MANFNFKPETIPLYFWCYRKSHYLTHPWKWFRNLRIGLKNAFHRMRYGFAWVDLWNMDSYLGTLVPSMLRTLAERSCGYPGDSKFPEPDVYKKWLEALALIIELANTEWLDADDEYENAKEKLLTIPDTEYPVINELKRKALDAMETEGNWTDELAAVGFAELGTYYHILWD